jgi:hypothetical protein
MATAPVDHHLNLLAQDILTYGSWGLTVVLLGVAVRLGQKERTPFYVLMVLASMVAAFAEPLYDAAMMLYFYSTGGMFTHFTAFDIPQPIWTHSGYAVLYATAAIIIARKVRFGTMTAKTLFALAGAELLMSCTFEIIGINGGAYTYWGPHALRIFDYPLVIGVLEAAQVVCFAVGAALLRERVKSPIGLLGLFVLFPCTFFMANFGAGAPTIIAIHLQDGSRLVVALASALSIVFAVWLIRAASSLLPVAASSVDRAVGVGAEDLLQGGDDLALAGVRASALE